MIRKRERSQHIKADTTAKANMLEIYSNSVLPCGSLLSFSEILNRMKTEFISYTYFTILFNSLSTWQMLWKLLLSYSNKNHPNSCTLVELLSNFLYTLFSGVAFTHNAMTLKIRLLFIPHFNIFEVIFLRNAFHFDF